MFLQAAQQIHLGRPQKEHEYANATTRVVLGYNNSSNCGRENCSDKINLLAHSTNDESSCQEEGAEFVAALKACKNLHTGIKIHQHVLNSGKQYDVHVANALMRMYAKCGSMNDARKIFDLMPTRDVLSWNAVILGYAENGKGEIALELYKRMQEEGFIPNAVSYVGALKACGNYAVKEKENGSQVVDKLLKLRCLHKGKAIDAQIEKSEHISNVYVATTMVDMYAKCGSMVDARRIFDEIVHPTVVSWTALIMGYADNGEGDLALSLYGRMQDDGCMPNSVTFVAALKACSSVAGMDGVLEMGKVIHNQIVACGYGADTYVANTLMNMFATCGSLVDSRKVFDEMTQHTVVSWNAIISAYVEEGEVALQLYKRMQDEGFTADGVTYVASLNACAKLPEADCFLKGKVIHNEASKCGLDSDIFVGNSLLDMYSKCGKMEEAQKVFDEMTYHTVVSWNTIILGYVESGEENLAIQLFMRMEDQGNLPERATFLAVLKACSSLAAIGIGRKIHSQITRAGLLNDAAIGNCLVDFYGKCGSMVDAQRIFDSIDEKNVVAWNALMTGYSRECDAGRVFQLFHEMRKDNLRPNSITFQCILAVCSHAGLVDMGKEYFERMSLEYGVCPDIEHYACMIHLLSRANELDEAVSLIQKMPFQPNLTIWNSVLSGCRQWRNVKIGRLASESIMRLEDTNSAICLF